MRHLAKKVILVFVVVTLCSCQVPLSKKRLVGKWRRTKFIVNQNVVAKYPNCLLTYFEFYTGGRLITRVDDNNNKVFDEEETRHGFYEIKSDNTISIRGFDMGKDEEVGRKLRIDYVLFNPIPGCGWKRLTYTKVTEGNIIVSEFRNIKE